MSNLLPNLLAILNPDKIREAVALVKSLDEADKSVITTWIVFEGLAQIVYYILLFTVVFLLGRRIIQAMIAGYREAKAESV